MGTGVATLQQAQPLFATTHGDVKEKEMGAATGDLVCLPSFIPYRDCRCCNSIVTGCKQASKTHYHSLKPPVKVFLTRTVRKHNP